MSELIFNGPAEFDMQIMVVNDETNQSGRVTVGLGVFEYPSKEQVKQRIEKFEHEELVDALEGFRLMTKEEAWSTVMYERTGTQLAMAGGHGWDKL